MKNKKNLFVVVLFIITIAVLVLIKIYDKEIIDWIMKNPQDVVFRSRVVFVPIVLLVSLPIFWFAVYFWRMGEGFKKESAKISKAYSLSNKNTQLQKEAKKSAVLLQFVSITLIFTAFVIFIGIWILTGMLPKPNL